MPAYRVIHTAAALTTSTEEAVIDATNSFADACDRARAEAAEGTPCHVIDATGAIVFNTETE